MATIKDVAREANVSVATVSRVFNSSGLVSEETLAEFKGWLPGSGIRPIAPPLA